jgi:hypothetical protein
MALVHSILRLRILQSIDNYCFTFQWPGPPPVPVKQNEKQKLKSSNTQGHANQYRNSSGRGFEEG